MCISCDCSVVGRSDHPDRAHNIDGRVDRTDHSPASSEVFSMQSVCCILGAGYSHIAGAPLTRDLFATRDITIPSQAAQRRFETIWKDYEAWLFENPSRNSEEYLADLLRHGQSATWTVNKRYLLGRRDLQATAAIERGGSTFSFPDAPVPARVILPFEWAVELMGVVLSTPFPSNPTASNFRYGARIMFPLHCGPHSVFWREVTGKANHVAAITMNYDILIERTLRHRRMTRVFGPGCYYGGIPKPQLLRGTQLPWAYQGNHIELEGAIPVCKLHGSLNWSRAGDGLKLFQDLRPAFRGGGDAAIIPPVPEKEIPAWLRPVWSSAEGELARAAVWIVCGYSLPSYDLAIAELLRRAATAGSLRSIFVLDPHASDVCCRYSAIAQNAQVTPLEGLPEGIKELRQLL